MLGYSLLGYNIIDADAHVNEPPDLWQKRMPSKLVDRAPKVIKLENGNDAWSFDGGKMVRALNLTAVGGLNNNEVSRDRVWTYDNIRPSSYDPQERLKDMDLDGIYAQVLFTSVGLTGAACYGDDRELQLACLRAYNDWLIEEFCARGEGRLFGIALLPTTTIDDTIAEAERAMKMGHKGVMLSRWPNGSSNPQPEDDKFWSMAAATNLPICLHVGPNFGPTVITFEMPGTNQVSLGTFAKAGAQSMFVVDALLGMGVGERFPGVKLLLVEANIGWIPCFLEQADDRWLHYRFFTGKDKLRIPPSEQFHRAFWATFMSDPVGVELRHHIGVDRIMWSTDFPHGGTEWPNSRNQIDRLFRDLPKDEKKLILHDNACNFYNLPDV